MRNGRLSLYYLAKYTNRELLVDELILTLGSYQLLSDKKSKRSIKFKIIRMKISYAIIFGILPIFPLLTYFQIADSLSNGLIPVETLIFTGSLFFSFYFVLQFFNFFLMAMLETGMIMTGRIFEWYETLPIPKEKIKKLVYFTIFRSFDIPIITIILSFPLTMLIGTQNIIIFIICFGISVLNVLFSFSILILFGGRINRVLDVHEINSKRSFRIRLLNIISFFIIILGSIYLIQWAFSSIDLFFTMFLDSVYPNFINLILSSIPYPFNPSYLISILIVSDQVSLEIWISTFIGFGLLAIITWWGHSRALNMIGKLTSSKFQTIKETYSTKRLIDKTDVSIKTSKPLNAYLRKDLVMFSHDLKTLMAIITSVLLSFLFSFYYNIGNIRKIDTPERLFFFNWVGILLYSPIIVGILIFSLLTIENTGQSILSSLPIVPRDQAKAKLLIIFIIQTVAVILPPLMYINTPHFLIIFISASAALPFIWILLLITFEMKISYFGKIRTHYYIEDIKQENKMFKWTLIMSFQYIITFCILSFIILLYFYQDFAIIGLFSISLCIIGYRIIIRIFKRMFPKIPEVHIISLKIQHPIVFSRKPWLSIFLILLLQGVCGLLTGFSHIIIINYLLYTIHIVEFVPSPKSILINIFILHILIYFCLLIIIVPTILGLLNGKKSAGEFLDSIGLGRAKTFIEYLKWAVIGAVISMQSIIITISFLIMRLYI